MSTITKPISIAWGTPATDLWLTVAADAAGNTVLRERAALGTTDAAGNLAADVADWDTDWRGYRVYDDGAGTVLRVAFEPETDTSGLATAAALTALAAGRTLADLATSEQVSQITDKLPSSAYLAGSDSEDGAVVVDAATGDGDTPVDHNWAGSFTVNGGESQEGGDDSLLITSSQGPVDGATIRAYVADDYDAGRRTVNAQTSTGSDGRWVAPLMLDPDDYVIVVSKPGVMVTTLIRLTVE